jgi:hypothetical protein
MDFWGTPLYISRKELQTDPILGYSCQDTLIRIIEDWKNLLDNNQYVAAILMDLSISITCFYFVAL